MAVKGIDVSSNNGTINWEQVAKSGIKFAYIKVSEGDYVNPQAKRDADQAKAAGLLVGAYCFVSPKSGRTGGQEADYFLTRAREAGLLKAGCLRPVADIEVTRLPAGKPSRRYHYRFVERIIKTTGIKPMIYTGSWFWDGVLGARNAHDCPLWLASYSPLWKRYVPAAFRKGVSIHQWTDKGQVDGINTHVDMNTYLGRDVRTLRRRHCLKNDL
jgi:lysozyme